MPSIISTQEQKHNYIFTGIQDKANLIAQAKKYIIKDILLKDMTAKANLLLWRVEDFKSIFKSMFGQGLPNF